MSQPTEPGQTLWVERLPGLDGWGLWLVCPGGPATLSTPRFAEWQAAAQRCMAERAEVAAISVNAPEPMTFLSGRSADLIGMSDADAGAFCSTARFERWLETATQKGLVHQRWDADRSALDVAASISVGIDAAWLGETEGGSQVVVFEMVRELARRPAIARIVLISKSGAVASSLAGIEKVSGLSWAAALAHGAPVVDVMHRPYQPGADVDYRRYHRVARCVALTVLDFIAYDNPTYHESVWAWRNYQQEFGESVALADCVFAISRYVGSRLEEQFAHQLSGPVRTTLLGTDHLQSVSDTGATAVLSPAVTALDGKPFLLVLGNDFEHKNRDFAVKVFADMRDRGYAGQLVLAGFHLDGGSSYGHELSGADGHADQVVRFGSVSHAEKVWLLRNADVVMYPTSAEGFGLVPFEAAALGTPTAFVRFGPLRETLPEAEACAGWQVRPFADHVFWLLEHPDVQVNQIQAAGASLTWSAHVDQLLEGYRHVLSPGAPWRTRAPVLPGPSIRLNRTLDVLAYRARNKLRRLAGRDS